ncbi:hypothetical protein ACFQZK_03890 [Rhodococcus aetherivorans]
MAAFAQPSDITIGGRPLTSAQEADAQMFLDAAASWIRDRKPDIAPDDPNAKLVSIQVVKAALISEPYLGLSSYSKTVGRSPQRHHRQPRCPAALHRLPQGAARHPVPAAPQWSFKVGDY